MADVSAATDYTLKFEDSTLSGVITTNDDHVTKTRFGIDQRYHPGLVACGFFNDMGSVAALQIARGIYERDYADALCIADIEDQGVANKLMSLGINLGVLEASKMLQLTLRVNGDGRIGPLTLHALESMRPAEVVESLDDQAIAHYHAVVEADPSKQKFLDGWIARAKA